jgi:hypothetical protein
MFEALRSHAWVYPALEVVHIVGIALLLGNLVALEMRVFGRAVALPVQAMARLSLSIAIGGFGLAAASGSLMFATQPAELLANRAFLVKMGLLLAAGLGPCARVAAQTRCAGAGTNADVYCDLAGRRVLRPMDRVLKKELVR